MANACWIAEKEENPLAVKHPGVTMDSICRLCMSNTQYDKLKIPLFQEQSPEFVHNLMTLLGFPIKVDDGLPSHICIACSEAAMKAHKFKTKCVESNKLLCERFQRESEFLPLLNEQNFDSSYEDDPEDNFEVQEAEDIETIIKKERETEADHIENVKIMQIFDKTEIDNMLPLSKFKKLDVLQQNMVTPSKEKPFQCQECLSKFKKLDVLQQNMVTPSKEKPFQCQECLKKFKYLGVLNNHMASHSQERPYQCKVCPSKFKLRGALKKHMVTHSRERPFQCKVCQSTFNLLDSLKKHMLTHSQKRPFQCKMCPQDFKLIAGLKRHMLTHLEEKKTFICDICAHTTKYRRNIITHIKSHAK